MFKQRTLEEWNRFILRNATYGAAGTTGECSLKCEELKNLVVHRESLRQMSKEQTEELNTQHGWFSNDIDDFKDFNTLNRCWYDGCNADNISFWSFLSESKWDYFLPVKSLQKFIEAMKGADKGPADVL